MWKKCKVIKLETEHEVPAFHSFPNISDDGYDTYLLKKEYRCAKCIKYHLYFISDDEIKEGDWILYKHSITGKEWSLHKVINPKYSEFEKSHEVQIDTGWAEKVGCKKIIASTDPSLNVARPSDDFIKEYCHKGGIDEVMVEYIATLNVSSDVKYRYQPILAELKVNPDNTINIKKIKDSWSREEVISLINRAWNDRYLITQNLNDWLKQNL